MTTNTASTPWTRPLQRGVTGKPIPRPNRSIEVQSYFPEFFKGMKVTMRHFFMNAKAMALGLPDPVLDSLSEGITTIHYPDEKRAYPERFRGLHRLTERQDGSPRCVACLCCSTACPAQCIHIVPGEYAEGDPRRGYERFPKTFVIDELRCIFCGFCVEACPCDAIRMDTGHHAVPYDSREQFIYRKELLMAFTDRDGGRLNENPRLEPGEEGHPGLAREHADH